MSKPISSQKDFDSIISGNESVLALFYASWCPFSRKFLPLFEVMSNEKMTGFQCIKVDDNESLCNRYSIEIYPSLLLFTKGKDIKRLDGIPEMGINKEQFTDFLSGCRAINTGGKNER